MLDGIKETFEDPDNADDIKALIIQAQKATHKIESVIKTVLDFSRPCRAQLMEADIRWPVSEAVNLCRATLCKAGIELKVERQEHLPRVFIDIQLIEQVILNIINNAAESMRSHPSPKHITLSMRQNDNDDVIIIISDSGPGIPEELQEKIFEPFFTTKTNGSGIGLSICQRIILDHGGTLQVASAEGGGSEFTITIPIAPPPARQSNKNKPFINEGP
jgi:signal transduction histidine kinase